MSDNNGASKWTIAFWMMATIAVVGIGTLSGYVVANDNKRAVEDQRIEANVSKNKDEIKDVLTDIKTQLAKIETTQGIMAKQLDKISK